MRAKINIFCEPTNIFCEPALIFSTYLLIFSVNLLWYFLRTYTYFLRACFNIFCEPTNIICEPAISMALCVNTNSTTESVQKVIFTSRFTFCLTREGVCCWERSFLFLIRILYLSWLGEGSCGSSRQSLSKRNFFTSLSPNTLWEQRKTLTAYYGIWNFDYRHFFSHIAANLCLAICKWWNK